MRLTLVAGTLGKLLQVFAWAFLAPLALAVYDAFRGGGWETALLFTAALLLHPEVLRRMRWRDHEKHLDEASG